MQTGRTVVIAGAAGGIGALLVRRFLDNGDTVIAVDLDPPALHALAQASAHHPLLVPLAADVTDEAACAGIAQAAQLRTGRIDVLINCVGYFPARPFEQISAAEWRRVVDINLTGVFLPIQACLPLIKPHGWGRIINYGSGTFFKGTPNQSHYIAAKAGVIGLTRCLASELGTYNITVNLVAPGLTVTDAVRRELPPAFIAAQRATRPLQRDQLPEDLVGPTFFLASPDADFITGQIVNVDGGAVKY
jgi:3-oxoacyl-[acyl-carrier protein] reductase